MADKKKENADRVDKKPSTVDVQSMALYLSIVAGLDELLNVKKPKKLRLTESQKFEVATVIEEQSKYLVQQWAEIGEICDHNDPNKITIGLGAVLDRTAVPSQVSTALSYAEKHSFGRKVEVPNPDQPDLPGALPDGKSEIE